MLILSRTAKSTTSASRSSKITILDILYILDILDILDILNILDILIQLQDADLNLYPVSFLCPNGTIFNQEIFICDWWSVE